MKMRELSYALGISESMAYRLKKHGMPTHSIEAAEKWRGVHLDPMKTKQHRSDGNTGRKASAPKPPTAPGTTTVLNTPVVPGAATSALDLAGERARLAKEQADRVAMQNAITRGELAPVALIEQVLAATAAKVAGIFDAIPGLVRRRVPRLSREELDLIAGEIAKVRNIVAGMSLSDLGDITPAPDDLEAKQPAGAPSHESVDCA